MLRENPKMQEWWRPNFFPTKSPFMENQLYWHLTYFAKMAHCCSPQSTHNTVHDLWTGTQSLHYREAKLYGAIPAVSNLQKLRIWWVTVYWCRSHRYCIIQRISCWGDTVRLNGILVQVHWWIRTTKSTGSNTNILPMDTVRSILEYRN